MRNVTNGGGTGKPKWRLRLSRVNGGEGNPGYISVPRTKLPESFAETTELARAPVQKSRRGLKPAIRTRFELQLAPDSTGQLVVPLKAKGPGRESTQFKPGAEWRGNARGRPKGVKNEINRAAVRPSPRRTLRFRPASERRRRSCLGP